MARAGDVIVLLLTRRQVDGSIKCSNATAISVEVIHVKWNMSATHSVRRFTLDGTATICITRFHLYIHWTANKLGRFGRLGIPTRISINSNKFASILHTPFGSREVRASVLGPLVASNDVIVDRDRYRANFAHVHTNTVRISLIPKYTGAPHLEISINAREITVANLPNKINTNNSAEVSSSFTVDHTRYTRTHPRTCKPFVRTDALRLIFAERSVYYALRFIFFANGRACARAHFARW